MWEARRGGDGGRRGGEGYLLDKRGGEEERGRGEGREGGLECAFVLVFVGV